MSTEKETKKTNDVRRKTKRRIIQAFGGKCGICGYSRCEQALDIHHLDPSKKEFSMGQVKSSNRNWNSLVSELRKCVMLCAICHREIHAGILQIPINIIKFNEFYSDYKNVLLNDEKDSCPTCGKEKSIYNKFCSPKCSGGKSWTIEWDKIDLLSLIKEHKSYKKVGEIIGVHGNVIKKEQKN